MSAVPFYDALCSPRPVSPSTPAVGVLAVFHSRHKGAK